MLLYGDRKRETKIQEICELTVVGPSLGCYRRAQAKVKGMATFAGLSTRTWGPALGSLLLQIAL